MRTEQVWIITAQGYFVSAYSTREKAYEALARLKDRGTSEPSFGPGPWTAW